MTPELEPLRRIAAYALCTDPDGRVLLVRAAAESGTPGVWSLPGGGVDHGEHPHDTLMREVAAEAGLAVDVGNLLEVLADLRALPARGLALHTDRLIYESTVVGHTAAVTDAAAEAEATPGSPDGFVPLRQSGVDLARWMSMAEAERLPLRPFTAKALGLPPGTGDLRPEDPPELPSFLAVPGPDGRPRAQRFAAYAVATDSAGRVLLTRIADGYPGAGRWHLPGGGTDFGEDPIVALLREVVEETGQHGRVTGLLGAASHRDSHSLGPEGYPIDWHGVRAYYRVEVAEPTATVVHDSGGSTAEAAWFSRDQLAALELTEVTAEAFGSAGVLSESSGTPRI
ncbi:MAG: NUDIX domain-containing protein [Micromonosporaceae bacterium]